MVDPDPTLLVVNATVGRRRAWRRVEVAGTSMLPTLEPGDRLLAAGWGRPRPGDLVVVADPRSEGGPLVKRVRWQGRDGEGRPAVWVEGDNGPASTDSRSWGTIPLSRVLGRVVWRYSPPARAGRIRPARLPPAPPGGAGSLQGGPMGGAGLPSGPS